MMKTMSLFGKRVPRVLEAKCSNGRPVNDRPSRFESVSKQSREPNRSMTLCRALPLASTDDDCDDNDLNNNIRDDIRK